MSAGCVRHHSGYETPSGRAFLSHRLTHPLNGSSELSSSVETEAWDWEGLVQTRSLGLGLGLESDLQICSLSSNQANTSFLYRCSDPKFSP